MTQRPGEPCACCPTGIHGSWEAPADADAVDHPAHYLSAAGGLEVIDVVECFELDFHEGNVVKYLLRYKRKNGVQDLEKAAWYLRRLIQRRKREEERG